MSTDKYSPKKPIQNIYRKHEHYAMALQVLKSHPLHKYRQTETIARVITQITHNFNVTELRFQNNKELMLLKVLRLQKDLE